MCKEPLVYELKKRKEKMRARQKVYFILLPAISRTSPKMIFLALKESGKGYNHARGKQHVVAHKFTWGGCGV